jgi:DNA-binding FadR family transcriptional regulator
MKTKASTDRSDSPASTHQDVTFAAITTGESLSSRVKGELVEAIVSGRLGPEESLPAEGRLAEEFEVSRQVVREAIKQLVSMGLVLTRQGRVSRVALRESWNHFAPEVLAARRKTGNVDDMLLELLELRRMVELEAVVLAAERRTADDVTRLREGLLALDDSLDGTSRRQFIASDLAFHLELLRATRNHLLPQMFQQLEPVLEFGREVSLNSRHDALRRSQLGHHAIFDAILRSDADSARAAMTEHLSWTANLEYSQHEARFNRFDPTE